MMSTPGNYQSRLRGTSAQRDAEFLRLEVVLTCVGFDDLLDFTLDFNRNHFDTFIVVTSHDDRATQQVGWKHGCTVVPTDLFQKNGRNFNKGAAINAGLNYLQWAGWRLHMDCDIVLPDGFRRVLFNNTHLDPDCLYGCDRVDIVGEDNIRKLAGHFARFPQHRNQGLVDATHGRGIVAPLGSRHVNDLEGYTPLGFFQLWNAAAHKSYPYSKGSAAHDDTMFAHLWPLENRRHLPSVVCYHICPKRPVQCENWDGYRKQPRLKL